MEKVKSRVNDSAMHFAAVPDQQLVPNLGSHHL